MTGDEALIDEIVRGVLSRLGTGGDVARGAPRPSAEPPREQNGQTSQPAGGKAVQIMGRVVTAELLEQHVGTATVVQFAPKAVLTPSARDYLKSHAVAWERAQTNGAVPKIDSAAVAWKAIVVHTTAALDAALEDLSAQPPVRLQRELAGRVHEAATLAVSALCRGESAGVLIATRQPDVAACLANRNAQVRAAVVRDVRGIETLNSQLGPNAVCFDPEGRSWFELRNMLKAITAKAPKLPAEWTS